MPSPDRADLERLRRTGDGPADQFVQRLQARLGGIDALANELNRLIGWYDLDRPPPGDLDAEVVEYVRDASPARPSWLSAGDVQAAQALFQDCRYAALLVLACASLPACYGQPHIAEVLSSSGRLVNGVRRRLQETVFFTSCVMTPGALEPGAAGQRWIRKVRLIHAMMRPITRANPKEGTARTGDRLADLLMRHEWTNPELEPVSQTELGFVLLTFSWLTLRGWRRLGIAMSPAEEAAFARTWAWIGELLGLRDELVAYARESGREVDGAEALYERIRLAYESGTEGGRLLAAALGVVLVEQQREALEKTIAPSLAAPLRAIVEWSLRNLPNHVEDIAIAMCRSLVRKLAGEPTARALRVGRAPFLLWIQGALLNDLVHWRGLARVTDPGFAASRGRRAQHAFGRSIDAATQAFARGALRY